MTCYSAERHIAGMKCQACKQYIKPEREPRFRPYKEACTHVGHTHEVTIEGCDPRATSVCIRCGLEISAFT